MYLVLLMHPKGANDLNTKSQNSLHIEHWQSFLEDKSNVDLYSTWWDTSTVNHWRHVRFLQAPLRVLSSPLCKKSSWLAIGDGSGHDSWILKNNGFKEVISTDIGTDTLRVSAKAGYIDRFEYANAEGLQYPDYSFDFVLCKEALHHMQMPYRALYEMIRVAKYAVVIVEPQDMFGDIPCLAGPYHATYEPVGNFIYTFSAVEMQKLCFGLNLPFVATKNMIDVYIQGCEFQAAEDTNPFFMELKQKVAELESLATNGEIKSNYLLTIIVKDAPNDPDIPDLVSRLKDDAWHVIPTNTNPHLNGDAR